MAEDLKSSAQVWGGGNEQPTEDSPPAYSGHREAEHASEQSTNPPTPRRPTRPTYNPLHRLTTLASVPFHKYNVPDGNLSPDGISLTVKHSELYSQPHVLLAFILEQATLPPKPTLHITGSHCGSIIDFDITLNLTHLLNLQKRKWRFNSAQVSPIHGASRPLYDHKDDRVMTMLSTNIRQFCKDRSENKSYTLTRTIEGLPTEMLAGQVRNLAASVKYRGLLKIDYVDERSKVIVHKQPSSWFSNVLGLHPEKKYEMAETVWDLSDSMDHPDNVSSEESLRAGQEWWKSWTSAIRNAMITKHKGNVGIEDWIEARMGHVEAEPRYEWGNYGTHQP